jgi:hypothetical protein
MLPLNTILEWNINIIMNKKYDNNNIIIASRAYSMKVLPLRQTVSEGASVQGCKSGSPCCRPPFANKRDNTSSTFSSIAQLIDYLFRLLILAGSGDSGKHLSCTYSLQVYITTLTCKQHIIKHTTSDPN